jgi:hypothetical protein
VAGATIVAEPREVVRIEAARALGVNLAFLGGNTGYWQIRYADAGRRLLEEHRSATTDPLDNPRQKTVRWRDAPVLRPECSLVGVQWQGGDESSDPGPHDYRVVTTSLRDPWFSGTGFKRWSGMDAPAAEKAALAGDAKAIAALDELSDKIARGLAMVIDILDPDVIVFGGGLSNIDALYPAVQGKLIEHVFSDVVRTRVVKNKHGDSSGVRGAAWLWRPEEAQ